MTAGLPAVLDLAAASGMDLGTTSDIVTDALTAFGMSAEQAGQFTDELAMISTKSNTNVSMLGESFKMVAPVAGALGYSSKDTAIALGLMANSGIKASSAGAQLRNIMANMSKPTDQMAAAMDELGISLTDSSGNMKSFEQITNDLRGAFSGLSEEQKAQYAATLAGKEGMSGLLAIVNASEADVNKLRDAMANCDGAAKNMATTMNDNLSGDLKTLNSAWEELQLKLFTAVEPALRQVVQAITTYVIPALTKLIEFIQGMNLEETLGKIDWKPILAIAGAAGVAIAALKGFQFLKNFNPFGAFGKRGKSTLSQIGTGLGNMLNKTIAGVGTAIQKVEVGFGQMTSNMMKGFGQMTKAIGSMPLTGVLSFAGVVAVLVGAFIALAACKDIVLPFLDGLADVIIKLTSGILQGLADFLVALSPILVTLAQAFATLSPLVEAFGNAFGRVIEAIGTAVGTILTAVTPIVEIIGNVFTECVRIIGDVCIAIIEAVAPVIPAIVELVRIVVDGFNQLVETVSNAIVAIVEAVAPFAPEIAQMVSAVSEAVQAICQAFQGIVEQIAPILDSLGEIIGTCFDGISQTLDSFSGIIDSVFTGAQGIIETFGNAVQGILDSVAGVIDSIGEAAKKSGQGFEALARGVERITKLNLWDMGASLGAVATGIGAIALAGAGIGGLGDQMLSLANGLTMIATTGTTASQVIQLVAQSMTSLQSASSIVMPMTMASQALASFAQSAMSSAVSLIASGVMMEGFGTSTQAVATACMLASSAVLSFGSAVLSTGSSVLTTASSLNTLCNGLLLTGNGFNLLANQVRTAMTGIGTTVKTICTQVRSTFTSTMSNVANIVRRGMSQALNAVTSKVSAFTAGGFALGNGVANGFANGSARLGAIARQACSNAVSAMSGYYGPAYSAGAYIGQGLANGMASQLSYVASVARQLASKADEAIQAKARIASPSKVQIQNGKYIGEGLALGMEKAYKTVRDAAYGMVELPQLAIAGMGGFEMSSDLRMADPVYNITVISQLDGREVARTTAPYTQSELERITKEQNLVKGRR